MLFKLARAIARRSYPRHLSPYIALKRICLTVDLTVSSLYVYEKTYGFRRLWAPETIEWE